VSCRGRIGRHRPIRLDNWIAGAYYLRMKNAADGNSSNSSNGSAVSLALGRIFGMMQRPTQPGDVEEYERCRAVILDELCPGTDPLPKTYRPNYLESFRGRAWEGQ
jgi:hypothetical protein